jgi:hypothetical protein
MKNYILIIIILLPLKVFSNENNIITELDLKTIQYGYPYSSSYIIGKIKTIYEKDGKDAIKTIVPYITNKVIQMSKEVKSESEFEVLMNYIWILNVTEDERAIPALLSMLPCEGVYSGNLAKAFMNYKNKIIPILTDSLYSSSITTRRHTSLTLKRMKEFDSTGTYFSENDIKNIRIRLTELISDTKISDKLLEISAIGVFGDETTIPILEEIKMNDQYIIENVRGNKEYINREFAEKSLNQLKNKLEKKKY